MKLVLALLSLAVLLVTGCQSPKLGYKAPPPSLNPSGPSIAVLPLVDVRTNKSLDKVLAKDYLIEVQAAVADELRSMARFSRVTVATNVPVPSADWNITPTLKRLEWEVPNYDSLMAKTFLISLATGGIGGGIYISTDTDVYGHVGMEFDVSAGAAPALQQGYVTTVTNRMAKASSDVPKTRAHMASQALQATLTDLKRDVEARFSNTNKVGTATK